MTRRFLPAWLLMAFMAFSAMMPAVASAQPVSFQNRVRATQNVQRPVDSRVSGRVYTRGYVNTNAYANSNQWRGNTVQAYRQPSRVSRSRWQPSTRQHWAPQTSRRDYRRR
jgi:hypothetical protein